MNPIVAAVIWVLQQFPRYGAVILTMVMVTHKTASLGRESWSQLAVDVGFANLSVDIWALVTLARGGAVVSGFVMEQVAMSEEFIVVIFLALHLCAAPLCARFAFEETAVGQEIVKVPNSSWPRVFFASFLAGGGLALWLGVL